MVLTITETVVALMAFPLLSMSLIFLIEIVASVGLRSKPPRNWAQENRPPVAILIPAHNESETIVPTLQCMRTQVRPEDRILVVADNCTDDTASLARKNGAEVIERTNNREIGKGYALSYGTAHLATAPQPVLIVIDADCTVGPDTIDILSSAAWQSNRPVQSCNLIVVGRNAPLQQRVSAFAFRIKNLVRYEGLRQLGLPCQLAGTGMAFPWPTIQRANLATGNIVEDMKLGVDLAVAGTPAIFEPQALVTSHLPDTASGQLTQRQRWEHGHVQTIVREVPRLVAQAFRQRRLDLLAMAADLFVIPLSLYAILTLSCLTISALIIALQGHPLPFMMSATAMILLVTSIVIAWHTHGRDLLGAREVAKIPTYVAAKLPIYFALLLNRENKWKRSTRANDPEDLP